MKRDINALTSGEFDLVVVGGGIFGACAAWDATQRGLSVAMIERGDFGGRSSANSYKLIHGGIRYIQHGDVRRVRESSNERRAFLRVAPHLVRPLPIVIPTYGHGMKGKEALLVGMGLYDLITADRNRGIPDPARRVPRGTTLSRSEALEFAPGLDPHGLTGGALFHDGQMHNPPRLVLSFVRQAANAGAVIANHTEATGFLRDGDRVAGVEIRDLLGGVEGTVRGQVVLNAAGPYADLLLDAGLDRHATRRGPYSRDACFVVNRRLFEGERALAVQGSTHDPEAHLSRGERHLFFAPWRQYTLVGVWHRVWDEDPNKLHVTAAELRAWLDEINAAYPSFRLGPDDVSRVNIGLVPFGENETEAKDLKYGHRSTIIDHAELDGIEGLITLIGVRYTMGRLEAARVVDLAFRKHGRTPPRCRTAELPTHGGEVSDIGRLLREFGADGPRGVAEKAKHALVLNHGSALEEVLAIVREDPALAEPVGDTTTWKAEVVHAVRTEMAQTLADVLARRTDIATGENPGSAEVETCVELMGRELGWDGARVSAELERWSPPAPTVAPIC